MVADNTFGVLNAHLAGALYQKHCGCNHCKQSHYFAEEHHQTALCCTETGNELLCHGLRETCDDTYHNDQRHSITNTLVGDALAKPQDEHAAGGEDNGGGDEEHSPAETGTQGLAVGLHTEVDEVSRSLEEKNQHSQITCVLVHLPSAALTLTLHLLEIRNCYA